MKNHRHKWGAVASDAKANAYFIRSIIASMAYLGSDFKEIQKVLG
jgi:hypothetical protein